MNRRTFGAAVGACFAGVVPLLRPRRRGRPRFACVIAAVSFGVKTTPKKHDLALYTVSEESAGGCPLKCYSDFLFMAASRHRRARRILAERPSGFPYYSGEQEAKAEELMQWVDSLDLRVGDVIEFDTMDSFGSDWVFIVLEV